MASNDFHSNQQHKTTISIKMPFPDDYDFENDEPYLPPRKKGIFEIFKQQPLIPLGLATIVGSFVFGSYSGLIKRNQKMSQLMMRVRVYSQFFTLLVISYHYGMEMARGER